MSTKKLNLSLSLSLSLSVSQLSSSEGIFFIFFLPSTSCSLAQGFAILTISMQLPYALLIRLYEDMELLCFYPQPPPAPGFFTDTFTCKSASDLSLLPGLSHTRGNLYKDQINTRI